MITWYKNGHLMEKERKYFGERSLNLEKIQFQDRGVYTCTAENLMGRAELSVNVSVKGLSKRLIISRCLYSAIVGIQLHLFPSLNPLMYLFIVTQIIHFEFKKVQIPPVHYLLVKRNTLSSYNASLTFSAQHALRQKLFEFIVYCASRASVKLRINSSPYKLQSIVSSKLAGSLVL